MTELVTDNIRQWIGRSSPSVEFEVSRRDIIKYSIATQQQQDKYLSGDEAPPMFLFGADRPLSRLDELGPDGLRRDGLMPELPLKRVMAGGIKQRYHRPVKPGDKLTITRTIADIFEKQGSSGPLIFIVYDLTVVDDNDQLVMRETQTRINR